MISFLFRNEVSLTITNFNDGRVDKVYLYGLTKNLVYRKIYYRYLSDYDIKNSELLILIDKPSERQGYDNWLKKKICF